MASNIEIKARASNFAAQAELARATTGRAAVQIHQVDTFFHVPAGRLKLREFGDGTGELIQYRRRDTAGPKQSDYILSPTPDPDSLKAALASALGVRAVVRKQRELYLAGQTRIHFDQVAGLGEFIELEVVLEPGQDPQAGTVIAERWMQDLHIQPSELVPTAYVDLIAPLA